MKLVVFLSSLLVIATASTFGQAPAAVSRLETEYRRTRADTLIQLNARYIASLEMLKRSQMTQNDLTGANASQALIDELKEESASLTAAKTGQTAQSPFERTIETFPVDLYLDNGRYKEKEVAFKLEQGLLRKARLVVTFKQGNPNQKQSTAGGIFIFRPGTPVKKVGEWTSKDSKKGEFSCNILEHLAEPGEYKLRFTTTAGGGETLAPKIKVD